MLGADRFLVSLDKEEHFSEVVAFSLPWPVLDHLLHFEKRDPLHFEICGFL